MLFLFHTLLKTKLIDFILSRIKYDTITRKKQDNDFRIQRNICSNICWVNVDSKTYLGHALHVQLNEVSLVVLQDGQSHAKDDLEALHIGHTCELRVC